MSTPIPVDPELEGFPPGSSLVRIPATCTAPADQYVPPTCSREQVVISIPDFRELANSGSTFDFAHWTLVVVATIILAVFILLAWWMWRNRHESRMSWDCLADAHGVCATSGGCDGCSCHKRDKTASPGDVEGAS